MVIHGLWGLKLNKNLNWTKKPQKDIYGLIYPEVTICH